MSRDSDIGAPLLAPVVGHDNIRLRGGNCGLQGVPQPPGVATLQSERAVKYARLMTSAWMRRIQAIIFELSQVDGSTLAIGQCCHDTRRPVSRLAVRSVVK